MKDKILILVIGILIGAIIASAGFVIYLKVKDNNAPGTNMSIPEIQNFAPRNNMQNDQGMPDMKDRQNNQNSDEFNKKQFKNKGNQESQNDNTSTPEKKNSQLTKSDNSAI